MRRLGLLAGGAALLVLAVALAPPPVESAATTMAALGRSLGGLRVAVVDALFLRAEAARREGRLDDAIDLYGLVLELDPDDDAAAAYVIDARLDALRLVPEGVRRLDAWKALYADVSAAHAARSGAPALADVAARTILLPLAFDARLGREIEATLAHPRHVALTWLYRAARATDSLPGIALDRGHLAVFAYLAVEAGAAALLDGDVARQGEAVAWGTEIANLRRQALREMLHMPTGDEPGDLASVPTLAEVLAEGLAVLAAIEARAPDAVEKLDAYRARVGETRGVERLVELAAR